MFIKLESSFYPTPLIRANNVHVKRDNMTHINDELDYIRGKIQKNVKYNLTVDNKAQY